MPDPLSAPPASIDKSFVDLVRYVQDTATEYLDYLHGSQSLGSDEFKRLRGRVITAACLLRGKYEYDQKLKAETDPYVAVAGVAPLAPHSEPEDMGDVKTQIEARRLAFRLLKAANWHEALSAIHLLLEKSQAAALAPQWQPDMKKMEQRALKLAEEISLFSRPRMWSLQIPGLARMLMTFAENEMRLAASAAPPEGDAKCR